MSKNSNGTRRKKRYMKARRVYRGAQAADKRAKEINLGYVTFNQDWSKIDPRESAAGRVHEYKAGDKVSVGRAVTTTIGRLYRLNGSVCWVGEGEVTPEKKVIAAAKWNPDARYSASQNNEFSLTPNGAIMNVSKVMSPKATPKMHRSATEQQKQSGLSYSTTSNNNNTNRTNISMDKSKIKALLALLKAGEHLNINFIGTKAGQSGDYTVVRTKTGRGKGGSRLVELVDAKKNVITTGTPDSAMILNLTVNGEFHGYHSESDLPVVFEKNMAQASLLKETFKRLLDAEADKTIDINSTVGDFNGKFTVLQATQLRGRGGQIKLTIQRVGSKAKDEALELWSLRHSGVINSVTILGEDEEDEEEDSE